MKAKVVGRADGNLREAWGGIASLQLLLRASWNMTGAGYEALTSRPAALVGLGARKGSIAPGFDADLVIFNLEEGGGIVDANKFQHRHKATPYDGRTLSGAVETTYLRGKPIFDRIEFIGEPMGTTLKRMTSHTGEPGA